MGSRIVSSEWAAKDSARPWVQMQGEVATGWTRTQVSMKRPAALKEREVV
jgi:hypothetical protein